MLEVQQLRHEPLGPESKAREAIQESNLVRLALRRYGLDGVLGLYAATAQFQAAEFGLRGGPKKKLDDAHFPVAASGVFRRVLRGLPAHVEPDAGLLDRVFEGDLQFGRGLYQRGSRLARDRRGHHRLARRIFERCLTND